MPFIDLKTTKKISADCEKELTRDFGEKIALIPGKSEKWLMLNFEAECRMAFAGNGEEDTAMIEVELFGGAGGAGITINPVAFLVVKDGDVTIKHIVSNDNAVERAVSLVPEMFDKVTKFANKKKDETTETAE